MSLRRIASRALSLAIFAYSAALRGLPFGARAARRWCFRIWARSLTVSCGQFSILPSARAAVTVTPRSMPITPPVPGAGTGSGTTANATCHCPLRKVPRNVFASGGFAPLPRALRRKRTQPQPGTLTCAHRRLSRRTTTERPMTGLPVLAFSFGDPSA
ncbi:hypothetical protein [Streptomyces sp. BK239]|uniref:hypothetical protein n=1 Tax=Streptomyces sp. BK239 TaxID=2512155 RepID=UPI001F5EBE36|nr:hypothetical protein [Streptomyces sp. BK239]